MPNENGCATDFNSQCGLAVRESVCMSDQMHIYLLSARSPWRGWLWVCMLKKLAERYCPLLDRNWTTCTVPFPPQNSKHHNITFCAYKHAHILNLLQQRTCVHYQFLIKRHTLTHTVSCNMVSYCVVQNPWLMENLFAIGVTYRGAAIW